MPTPEPNNNIYNTHSPGDKEPEREYANLPLTKAKSITRNRAVTGALLGGSVLAFALWFALVYRAPDRDRSQEDGVEFKPEMISLQDGVIIEATGQTNSLVSGFDVSSYLPEGWGQLPNTDALSNPNIQVLNPIINNTEVKRGNLIIETNDVTTLLAQVAEKFIRDGKLDLAEEQLKLGLAQRPNDINCLDLMGSIYALRGQHAKAIEHYNDLIERNPYNEDYYNNLAVAYMRDGKLDKAETTLKEALKTNVKYYDAHVNLAILYRQKDRPDLIVKQLDPIIADIKDNQRALKYLAYALLDIGEPYRARIHFVELVRMVPETGDYYLRVAECYAQENTPEKAAAWLKLSTDHASTIEIETALLRPAFQRIAETRSMRLFRKSLDKDS